MNWEIVIGIETHVQLATNSKIFSNAPTAFGAPPNTQASVVDLALPGTLPVLNGQAVQYAIKFGLAVNDGRSDNIARRSVFARKNYFYPDLPKGYQISQFESPVVTGGSVTIYVDGMEKVVTLTRAHLEEDAGKSLHEGLETAGVSGIDLNRAGTPLLEVVSEPDMRSAAEAVAYAKALHGIVTWIGICDGNMQEGSFRCDANVSVRLVGAPLGTRCEIKNLNSFRFMEKAINYETRRQIELIEDGGKVIQQTRLYDADRDETRAMRSKEDAMDYRYFPDPDLLPLAISDSDIAKAQAGMPELPGTALLRYLAEPLQIREDQAIEYRKGRRRDIDAGWSQVQYGLPRAVATQLVSDKKRNDYFEATIQAAENPKYGLLVANWVVGEVTAYVNDAGGTFGNPPLTPAQLALLARRIDDGTISGKTAKEIFHFIARGDLVGSADDAVDQLIAERGLRQVSDTGAIEKIVDEVLAKNEKSVAEFKSGKEKALQALVGQVMKASAGKANPGQVNDVLRKKLAD